MGKSGTGLGMAVVWGTVKDHSGYIDVKSEQNRGSQFTLYFPVNRALREHFQAKTEPDVMTALSGSGERILVIDDVIEQQEIACRMLAKLGYSVAGVSSGEAALEYLENHEAELIVLDMIMDPGMDGLDTYRRISRKRPGQKAVIISGFSESNRVRELQRLGAGAYVKKPFLLEELGRAVKHELTAPETPRALSEQGIR
jgi:CheY-like chemotaxis protein